MAGITVEAMTALLRHHRTRLRAAGREDIAAKLTVSGYAKYLAVKYLMWVNFNSETDLLKARSDVTMPVGTRH